MPKLGRRNETHHVDYMYPTNTSIVTRNAPFGTFNTPVQKPRIIGGKLVYGKEDGNYGTPRWAQSPDQSETCSPGRGRSRTSHNTTPNMLAPLSQNPTNFNPHSLLKQGNNFYSSAQHDTRKSHLHGPDNVNRDHMNPHNVLPPISNQSTPTHYLQNNAYQDHRQDRSDIWQRIDHNINQPTRTDLTKYLPTNSSYLPKQPIHLSKSEELELRKLVREDLLGFNTARLKDVYLELTGYDRDLTGSISYDNLLFALLRSKVCISTDNLRLVASLFVAPDAGEGASGARVVNYEKVLSFISAAQKYQADLTNDMENPSEHSITEHHGSSSSAVPSMAQTNLPSINSRPDKGAYFNPITQEDHSPRSKKFPYGDGDNGKLLRQIEEAIIDSKELDYGHIYDTFRRFDRGHREMLSREQIKALSISCRIPLQGSLIDKIINKVDSSNGQYSWVQYLEFLERVQPAKTGLSFPESKRPVDYAKHYPEPSTNWPQNSGQLQAKQTDQLSNLQAKGDSLQNQSATAQLSPAKLDYHQSSISNVEVEIKRLEEAKKRMLEEEQQRRDGLEPWFQRFMKLAKALYDNDIDANGYLPKDEVNRLIRLHNDTLLLEFNDDSVAKCVQTVAQNEDNVPIDTLLKMLSLQHS